MYKYMISNGSSYLKRDAVGNFTPVKNRGLGDMWDSRSKAQNILDNCVNKNLRARYNVIDIIYEPQQEVKKVCINNTKPNNKAVNEISNIQIKENQINDLMNKINSFSDFIQSTEQRKESLSNALSEVDKEISDINHYIELKTFNAYQGWAAFNMLRNTLIKRRKIKDELHILKQFGECKINSSMIEQIKKSVHNLDEREYQPRVLKGLFE